MIQLQIKKFQSIIYLFRNASARTIELKLKFMIFCEEISKTPATEIKLDDESKFCYAKLALAKLMSAFFKYQEELTEEATLLYEELAIKYSKDLCEADFTHSPEPYLFYVMLTW